MAISINTKKLSSELLEGFQVSGNINMVKYDDATSSFIPYSNNENWDGAYNCVSSLSGNWNTAYERVADLTQNLSNDTLAYHNESWLDKHILSNSERVWIRNPKSSSSSLSVGTYSDLSIMRVDLSDYGKAVVDNMLCDNVLYIVDSDNINAFGQKITNLSTEGYEPSDAANTNYVNDKIQHLSDSLQSKIDYLSSLLNSLEGLTVIVK